MTPAFRSSWSSTGNDTAASTISPRASAPGKQTGAGSTRCICRLIRPWISTVGREPSGSISWSRSTSNVDYFVRTKKRLSSFYPTDLEFLLKNLDVDNLVITGTFTDACVLSTAFDAANRDFRVIVPRDVVAGYSAEAEHAALMIISLHLGLVVDSAALVQEWMARRGKRPATRKPARSARLAKGRRKSSITHQQAGPNGPACVPILPAAGVAATDRHRCCKDSR